MAYKDPAKQREATRAHYQSNKKYYKDKARRTETAFRNRVKAIKEETPCTDCGMVGHWWRKEFDHRPDEDKLGNVADLMRTGSWTKTKAEIDKCDVVCANCHRDRTHERLRSSVEEHNFPKVGVASSTLAGGSRL